MKVAIVGGGAAGFFSAIHVKTNYPKADVTVFEKTAKLLSKVRISGGGRCNVTNACSSISKLSSAYPRGGKKLKKLFSRFSNIDTMKWFEDNGVPLTTQEDNHVFPVSQDSKSVIDCFLNLCSKLNINIQISCPIKEIIQDGNKLRLIIGKESKQSDLFHKVIISTGGCPKRKQLEWLESLGHKISAPVPSLFTFNMPNEKIRELMGVVVENVQAKIQGTKLQSSGPLLITHWGMSGPAIIILSAFGARVLEEKKYSFNIQINWVNITNNETVYKELESICINHPNKILNNYRAFGLPDRLWKYFLEKIGLSKEKKWSELGKKGLNKLTTLLTNDIYSVEGKTTFKEEFVTCGGISLDSVNMKTMESLVVPSLYFTGEILDIDGITGGYNFQSAWTTAYIAAQLK